MSKYDYISIIIPSDGRSSLADTLNSILNSRSSIPYEVLVVGTLPDGMTLESPVHFIQMDGHTTGHKRNIAAQQAKGDLLLFTDSDCIVDPEWIEQAAASVSPEHPVVGGAIRFPTGSMWDLGDNLAIFHHLSIYCKNREITSYMGTNNLAVTKNTFIRTGGFRDDLTVGEDWDFLNRARKMGFPTWFSPAFAVLHRSGRDTPAAVRKHAAWYAEGYMKLLTAGVLETGQARAEKILSSCPVCTTCWSFFKACWQTLNIYLCTPAHIRYLHAAPAAWLFLYTRRRSLFQHFSASCPTGR